MKIFLIGLLVSFTTAFGGVESFNCEIKVADWDRDITTVDEVVFNARAGEITKSETEKSNVTIKHFDNVISKDTGETVDILGGSIMVYGEGDKFLGFFNFEMVGAPNSRIFKTKIDSHFKQGKKETLSKYTATVLCVAVHNP